MSLAFSAVIPAFNEEKTVLRAIRETKHAFDGLGRPYEIIVVDDGSTDKTAEIVASLRSQIPQLTLIRHTKNFGKGAAVKTGAEATMGEIILFLDCDLATHPSEFASFLPLFEVADIVIGTRRVRGARIEERQPHYRVWLGRLFNLAIRTYLDLPFHDTQCGFKAFTKKTKPLFASLRTHGWTFDVELLVNAQRQGYKIKEAPVTWRNGRESRVKLSHALEILRELYRIKHASEVIHIPQE